MSTKRYNITLTDEERKLLDRAAFNLEVKSSSEAPIERKRSRSAIIGWLIRKEFGKQRQELA
jgi:hypothetical protein